MLTHSATSTPYSVLRAALRMIICRLCGGSAAKFVLIELLNVASETWRPEGAS
jgi:hypothetical protein